MQLSITITSTLALAVAVALPAHAQKSASQAKPDSTIAADAAAPRTGGRFGGLMARARGAAKSAEKVVESREDLAQAALLVAGKSNPGVLMMKSAIEMQKRDRIAAAAAQTARAATVDAAPAKIAVVDFSGAAGSGEDKVLEAAQTEYMALAQKAMAGDKKATEQLARFSQELTTRSMSLVSQPPAEQELAYGRAFRGALDCATKGKDCRTR